MYITGPAELWALEITKSSRTEIVNSPIANCKEGVIAGEGGTFLLNFVGNGEGGEKSKNIRKSLNSVELAKISKNWQGFGKFIKFYLPKSYVGGRELLEIEWQNFEKNGVGGPHPISDGRVRSEELN